MRPLLLFLLIALAVPFGANAQSPPTEAQPAIELPPELDRVLRDYEDAWRSRDEERLAKLFTDDGFVLRPNHPAIRGQNAIRQAYKASGGSLFLRAYAFEQSDLIAYIIGGFSYASDQPDRGKYVLTLRRDSADSPWQIFSDMDNGN